ncbi:solute carrier family 22 member 15-like [Saccostrea echinata]|uniref:solute carrier family 22 member 15-like n=1 Tax=Saccostrea echinata TaxID=191078 RepID=UPI002A7F4139|nr:solute carrier family 22 member 15-like [Saccostrea echinata]
MSDELNHLLENVLLDTGGLGCFQFIIIAVINLVKFPITWSVLMMTFGGATPDWWCDDYRNSSMLEEDKDAGNESVTSFLFKKCSVNGSDACRDVHFDSDMNTIISEWRLICGESWVPGIVISIQMAGLFISGYLSGQLSDMFGRRLIIFISILLNAVANFVAAFSTSWQMFASLRFVIGISSGLYLAIYMTYIIEFTPMKSRPMIQAIPSWSLAAAFYGLLAWLLPDWRYIQIVTGAVSVPFFACWFIVPESFRWLVSHKKMDEAKKVVDRISKLNKVSTPSLQEVEGALEKSNIMDRKYTVVDICKHGYLLKRAVIVSFAWMAMAYTYYGISFGVDKLSGSLYINIFVLSFLEIPGAFLAWYFMKRIGRRWAYMIFSLLSAAGGIAVGLAKNFDFNNSWAVINGFAFVAKLGCAAGWSCLFIITTECYPTVLRTTGYGLASSLCRIGPILAPLALSTSDTYKGFLYFTCGVVTCISGLSIFCIHETKDRALEDLIGTDRMEVSLKVTDSGIQITNDNTVDKK